MVNVTLWANMSNVGDLITRPNQATGDVWGMIIFLVTYVVLFLVFTQSSNEKVAFAASSAIMSIAAIFMAVLNPPLINPYFSIIPIVLTIIAVIIMQEDSGSGI